MKKEMEKKDEQIKAIMEHMEKLLEKVEILLLHKIIIFSLIAMVRKT